MLKAYAWTTYLLLPNLQDSRYRSTTVGIIGDMKSVSYGLEANRFAENLCWAHKPDEKQGGGGEYQFTGGQSIQKRAQLRRSFRPLERMSGTDARLVAERGGEHDGEIEEAGKLSGPRVKSDLCERTREHIAPGITWRWLSRFAANGGRWASKPEPKALTLRASTLAPRGT